MKKYFLFGLFLFSRIAEANAQKVDADDLVDSIYARITQFYRNQGFLDKQNLNAQGKFVYATEIKQGKAIGYDTSGIYRIGVYQSHSPEHILIKQGPKYIIINLQEISTVLIEMGTFFEANKTSQETMLNYLSEILAIYQGNKNENNFRLKK